MVTQLMKDNFKDIVDVKFTADMESKLDKVKDGGTGMDRGDQRFLWTL